MPFCATGSGVAIITSPSGTVPTRVVTSLARADAPALVSAACVTRTSGSDAPRPSTLTVSRRCPLSPALRAPSVHVTMFPAIMPPPVVAVAVIPAGSVTTSDVPSCAAPPTFPKRSVYST